MKHAGTTVVLIACAMTVGCGDGSKTPSASNAGPLQALEPYDVVYMLDSSGQVVKLRLEGRHVTASVLDEVGKFPELTSLSLYAATIPNESLTKLENLKMLEELGLGETPITDEGLTYLTKLYRLKRIWLPRRQVTNEGIEELKNALPGLTVYFQ